MNQTAHTQIKAKVGKQGDRFTVIAKRPEDLDWILIRTVDKNITARQIAIEINAGRYPIPKHPMLLHRGKELMGAKPKIKYKKHEIARAKIMKLYDSGVVTIAVTKDVNVHIPKMRSTQLSTHLNMSVKMGLLERHAIGERGHYEYAKPGIFRQPESLENDIVKVVTANPGIRRAPLLAKLDCAIPYSIVTILNRMVDEGRLALADDRPKVAKTYIIP